MKYLANLCFAGSRGKRNKRQRKEAKMIKISQCVVSRYSLLYRNIMKAIGKNTVSQYSLLHRNIMDAIYWTSTYALGSKGKVV